MAEPGTGRSGQQDRTKSTAARPKDAGSTKKKRSWPKRIALGLAVVVLVGILGVAGLAVYGYTSTTRPNPNADFQTATTFVYYNNGKSQLGSFAVQNRQPLTFEEIPDNVKQAVVAAENRDFWTDKGISIRGMFRAAWVIARGGDLQGGSTITQQYIKIMYLNSEQTVTRKFRELFLAYRINSELSKEEILTDYLNTIYFGRGAYGIQAASKAYFNVDAKDLTTQQAAVLVSVINNPSLFDPGVSDDNIPRLQERYSYVLNSMAETGDITPAEAAQYAAELPKFPEVKINERYGGPKGFLLKMVQSELAAAGFDESQVNGGGLKITTTFDKAAQNAAVEAAQSYTKQAADARGKKASNLHAAIASVEVGSGEVLALYGGPDYVKNSRNWATTARPTASTFKTYALAAGLKDGFSLNSRVNGNTFTPPGDPVPVRNEFNYQYGSGVTLLKAAADSINTAFVDLTMQMDDGPQAIIDMAKAVGAPKGAGWDLNSRIALGTAEVSPLNQANAYATFANDGTYVAPHVVKEVTDASGNVVYRAAPDERKAVSADIAHDVTYALQNVVEQGTGSTVRTLDRPVAGKTGTKDVEDDITSAWFVAYTPQISTAVMYVAGPDGNADLDDYARPGDSTFFGGTYPALTWVNYMQIAVQDLPVEQFDEAAWVNRDSAPQQTYAPAPTRTWENTRRPTQSASSAPPTQQTSEPPSKEPTSQRPTEEPTSEQSSRGPSRKPNG
ncbi:putative penicillin binding protein [Microlunatus phosphovorus NM-1]|uniref:Putative penicillin binding protein n=1 Tax=Microlunatus phosphovorus (strain ATCC 700054 / DSM 10555 / JCM 9379 / NBRC 101784 / NCIMB 13414 / VKM Ac-1990 / NM-1) TaxID=1032480 RepID=F5XGL7_MICPN|nr:transglycosylase domain-containing protein [Microlunatus phosphovorus]BAK33124.1 putative penicillin binding protein [Microlunatus phosphovorus NM-1]